MVWAVSEEEVSCIAKTGAVGAAAVSQWLAYSVARVLTELVGAAAVADGRAVAFAAE